MKNDHAYLSIDFLAGFTIFMIAFIWVATMIPGLFVNVRSTQIDYDAVAYRTGVILTEDPGWQVDGTSDWEVIDDARVPEEVRRIGWAISKENPGVLSAVKMNRSFCSTAFTYPESYQDKIIFGDMPYRFNISVLTNGTYYQSVGDVRPSGAYGYIRRVAKVKQMSDSQVPAYAFMSKGISPKHMFSPEMNITDLLFKEQNLAYQINPRHESTAINVTNISWVYRNQSNLDYFDGGTEKPVGSSNLKVHLLDVNLTRLNPSEPLVAIPPFGHEVYIDGSSTPVIPRLSSPVIVQENVSIVFNSTFFAAEGKTTTASRVFVNFTFGLWNTTNLTYDDGYCINSTYGNNLFRYDYGSPWVREPVLEPAILEVAVW
ncbi:MAG TPA: hypothetical protein P5217_04475 [Methanoregulaceae archaeon]|nr:hypothetical protein [Methanoregulaceae archaeon]HPD75765.1 hypothetical protein [Methanoregulaceae archaeon]HRY75519.1 hypothetical protein [Methanoregulaceae archaeon]